MEKRGVTNGPYCKVSGFTFDRVAVFRQSTVCLWNPIWPKITPTVVYGDYMFLSTTLLKISSAKNGHC